MPRKSHKVPSYCHHKASGKAVVRINGRDCYLGEYGSPESHEQYERIISEWRGHRNKMLRTTPYSSQSELVNSLTVNELILRYLKFAENYYVKNGQVTKEFTDMKYALRPLRKLYGRTFVRDFGPLALKSVRQHMIDVEDLSRGVINNRINRIKRVIKWSVSEELAPSGAYESLRAVSGLKFGRTTARETEPVKPVDQVWVDAVIKSVSPQVAAMIAIQQLAAMRPCEVVSMRLCDIDMSGDVWIYEPFDHKNRWRGYKRVIPLGPKAQSILKPFLSRSEDSFLFSPIESEEWRNEIRRQNRKSPMTPSQAKRKRKKNITRQKRDRYDVESYRRAITYGIKKCNRQREKEGCQLIPHWYPLQLRHSRATEVRKDFGIEAAQVVLGHARADVTEVYAERNLEAAIQVAKETG